MFGWSKKEKRDKELDKYEGTYKVNYESSFGDLKGFAKKYSDKLNEARGKKIIRIDDDDD